MGKNGIPAVGHRTERTPRLSEKKKQRLSDKL